MMMNKHNNKPRINLLTTNSTFNFREYKKKEGAEEGNIFSKQWIK